MGATIKATCSQCANFDAKDRECSEWEKQIKRGVSVQQNANFYRTELGGDSLYVNCEFLPDEPRDCRRFNGKYSFTTGD